MPEINTLSFSHKEVAEAIIKYQNIHEGIWGIYIEFGIGAANVGPGPSDVLPSAIVPVLKIGIQRFPEPNNLTVDAAVVNPITTKEQSK